MRLEAKFSKKYIKTDALALVPESMKSEMVEEVGGKIMRRQRAGERKTHAETAHLGKRITAAVMRLAERSDNLEA